MTLEAVEVVVVLTEEIAEFELVFPASIYFSNNPRLNKCAHSSIYACTVNFLSGKVDKLLHGDWTCLRCEYSKHLAPSNGIAQFGRMKRILISSVLVHVANNTKIATKLQ